MQNREQTLKNIQFWDKMIEDSLRHAASNKKHGFNHTAKMFIKDAEKFRKARARQIRMLKD